jgi:hypothetical protein
MRKLTQEMFEKKCTEIYGNRYSFEKTIYKNYRTKLTVYDNETKKYLDFFPGDLLSNKIKGINKKYNTENFIKWSKEIFGDDTYDYHKTSCNNSNDDVIITCKHHGDFIKKAYVHIDAKQGCPLCSKNFRTKEQIINEATKIYGNIYDYSLIKDAGRNEKIKIICKKHGIFEKYVYEFLDEKRGCPKCSIEEKYKKIDEFIKDSEIEKRNISIIGDFKNSSTKTTFRCEKCGYEWVALPSKIQSGRGCPKCSKHIKPTTDEFIKKSKEIHKEDYDYSLVNIDNATYKNNYHVDIICKKHGIFSQSIHLHMNGGGCPICKESNLEKEIRHFLDEQNIKYEMYWKNENMRNKNPLSLDFYLPEYNMAIECQGKFHFEIINALGGEIAYKRQNDNDIIKHNFCKKNNIKLLYYTNLNYDIFLGEKLYKDKEELLKEIKGG